MLNLKNPEDFRMSGIRGEILESLDYAFRKNSPEKVVSQFLHNINFSNPGGRVVVVGFGKAARGMFRGARQYLEGKIYHHAIIVPEYERDGQDELLYGGHPLPTGESIASSLALLDALKGLNEEDVVLVLISGGGSSLFEVLRDGITLEEYNRAVGCVMEKGADIYELNSIRYLYSEVKGGGLLRYTYPAKVLGLIISDVPGDDIDTVSSGPTANAPSAERIDASLRKYGDVCNLPRPPETIKGRRSPSTNYIILRNQDFIESIVEYLRSRGYTVVNLGSTVRGSTQQVASFLMSQMRKNFDTYGRGFLMVGGGETSTVRLGEAKGGRNLELCLRVLLLLGEDEEVYFGSFGTDGIDGSSGAMGAIVDSKTLSSLGKERILSHLGRSESLLPLLETKDVLFTGPTGTNLSDVFVAYYSKRRIQQ